MWIDKLLYLREKAIHYVKTQNAEHIKEMSNYNKNYYRGDLGDLIFAESDDDDTTDYYFVIDDNKYGKHFAYSYTSNGDKLILDFE